MTKREGLVYNCDEISQSVSEDGIRRTSHADYTYTHPVYLYLHGNLYLDISCVVWVGFKSVDHQFLKLGVEEFVVVAGKMVCSIYKCGELE